MDTIINFVRTLPGNPWGIVLILVLFALGLTGAVIVAWADRHNQ